MPIKKVSHMAATYKKGGINIKIEYTLNFMLNPNLTQSELHFYKLWKSQFELELKEAKRNNNLKGIKEYNRLLAQLDLNFSK